MIRSQHPHIGLLATAHGCDYIVNGLQVPIESELKVHLGRGGADSICKWECAAPTLRGNGTLKRGKQWLRICVGDGQRGDFWQRPRVFTLEALRVRCRSHTWGEGIAGIKGRIEYAAALNAVGWAHRAVGKNRILRIAVICRVGVDDAGDGTVLGRELWLDAAP